MEIEEKFYGLSYEEALVYFSEDTETLEFLESLTDDEKTHFNMLVHVDPENEHVSYVYGHFFHSSPHLPQVGDGVCNDTWEDDNYEGAIEKLQSIFEEGRP